MGFVLPSVDDGDTFAMEKNTNKVRRCLFGVPINGKLNPSLFQTVKKCMTFRIISVSAHRIDTVSGVEPKKIFISHLPGILGVKSVRFEALENGISFPLLFRILKEFKQFLELNLVSFVFISVVDGVRTINDSGRTTLKKNSRRTRRAISIADASECGTPINKQQFNSMTVSTGRPKRAAAPTNLKEQSLKKKLRRGSNE